MITKIKEIKNLGIFSDFAWDSTLQVFGRYNLIYGWNGSGKTTFSNLFAGLPVGSVASYPELEYEIETEAGTVKNGLPLGEIRVFNRDYVANNVHTLSGKAKPILVLGEENKKSPTKSRPTRRPLPRRRQKSKLEEESSESG